MKVTTFDKEARYLDCQTWRDVAGGVRDCVTSVVSAACYMHQPDGILSSLSELLNVTDCWHWVVARCGGVTCPDVSNAP